MLYSNIEKTIEYQKTMFSSQDFQKLHKIRIIQKNLVHFLGFPDSLLNENLLKSKDYFGQFGKIIKLMLSSKIDPLTKKKSNSAYITFSKNKEAAHAILTFDSLIIEGNIVRCFFGTSKYCVHFLNNIECFNKDKCMFIHNLANKNDILGINCKFGYSEHIKLAKKIINYDSFENYNMNLKNDKNINSRNDLEKNKKDNSKSLNNYSNSNNKNLNNKLENESLYKDNISNINFNNIKINNNINNKSSSNIFKYRDKSRFFDNNNKMNDNEMDIPESFKDLIDKLSVRIPYFNKYEDLISKKNLEIYYIKQKMNFYNDSWLNFICTNID